MADKPFKATDEDWRSIENAVDIPHASLTRAVIERAVVERVVVELAVVERAVIELRDRVAALEAERVAPKASTTASTPPAAAPSDEELWEVQYEARKRAMPNAEWQEWHLGAGRAPIAAHRALYDHGYERGLADGRAEQGGTPEPEPEPEINQAQVCAVWMVVEAGGQIVEKRVQLRLCRRA